MVFFLLSLALILFWSDRIEVEVNISTILEDIFLIVSCTIIYMTRLLKIDIVQKFDTSSSLS